MPFPFYKQPDSMDCGPTCLRSIAKYYGKHYPLQYLREKTQIGKNGVNMLGISDAAEAIGFRTIAAQLTVRQLEKEAVLPAIVHWNQDHFVVLYKVRKGQFYIADPAKGLVRLSRNDFAQHWISDSKEEKEGIALLLEPTAAFYNDDTGEEEENIPGNTRPSDRNIFRYLRPHKKLVLQVFLGLGIASLLQLFLPFLTQSVVDVGVNSSNIHFIYIVLFAQLALFAGRLVIEFVRSWILLHISTRINLSILTDFLVKMMRLPVSFFDSKRTGDILQRMNDHNRIETFLTGSSIHVLFSLVNLIVFSVVLAMFHFGIFTVFMLATLLYAIWVIVFLKKRKQLDYKRFAVSSREQGFTIQLVQGMQEIKLNNVEKAMRWSWERIQAKQFRLTMKNLALNQWQQAGASFINEGKNIFITFLSAKAVIDGHMTLGTMLAVQYMLGQLNSPTEQLVNFVQNWQNAKISMDRLNEVHRMDDEEPDAKKLLKTIPPVFTRQLMGGKDNRSTAYTVNDSNPENIIEQGMMSAPAVYETAISFNDVSFTYPGAGNEPVLKSISLTIPKGKTTAIIGVSGSGKTTLLKLLLKFYEPQKGDMRLGNLPLAQVSHSAWRSLCGVVMQESFIFSDTIARNIAVGQEAPDMERLEQAVAIASLRELIAGLPLGYNTKIGAEGNGISMGQKQRILIARAVYRDPQFIFFDEATNSLDANNEAAIVQNLGQFFRGRTVVVVAHRLSTVKHADQIIVLNKGMIAERGSHEELISLRGEYFTLVKNQLELGD